MVLAEDKPLKTNYLEQAIENIWITVLMYAPSVSFISLEYKSTVDSY